MAPLSLLWGCNNIFSKFHIEIFYHIEFEYFFFHSVVHLHFLNCALHSITFYDYGEVQFIFFSLVVHSYGFIPVNSPLHLK